MTLAGTFAGLPIESPASRFGRRYQLGFNYRSWALFENYHFLNFSVENFSERIQGLLKWPRVRMERATFIYSPAFSNRALAEAVSRLALWMLSIRTSAFLMTAETSLLPVSSGGLRERADLP
jgi:hypothetical protein